MAAPPRLEASILDAREAQLDDEARSTDFRTAYRTPQELEEAEEMTTMDCSIYLGSALIKDSAHGDTLGKVSRYEARLLKDLEKMISLLEEADSARREPARLEAVEAQDCMTRSNVTASTLAWGHAAKPKSTQPPALLP